MVTHFRNIGQHKWAVLEIYRQLLRHTTHLPKYVASFEQKHQIARNIKYHFKKSKSLMSPAIATKQLQNAYRLEEIIRDMFTDGSGDCIKDVIELSKPKSKKDPQLRNIRGQPMKLDINNIQDKETQQITNYINRYIRTQQASGDLPSVIDPIIRNSILKDEALHVRAQMDINRAETLIKSGPYRAHISLASRVGFIRVPWRQNPKISRMILNYVKKEQIVNDMINVYERERHLYDWETRWEKSLRGKQVPGEDWNEFMKETIAYLKKDLEKRQKYFELYRVNELPSKVPFAQAKCDEIHNRLKSRKYQLDQEVSERITAFEGLMGKQTLWDLVKKYKLHR